MKFLIFILEFALFYQKSRAFFGSTFKFNLHDEPQFASNRCCFFNEFQRVPVEKFIEQNLDNFNPQNTRRWKMRYYENDAYFEPGGPIFIFLGGEWKISSGSITQGTLIVEMAQEMRGILFYTEHRFYGQSRPTNNTSTENLRFLTIDQALADVAHFIDSVKRSSPDFNNSSVIVVGASYSATMAAWMRKKFPHLVDGAFASSGPVQAQIDFYQYKEVMSRSIERVGGDECAEIIGNAFSDMEELVELNQTERITNAFNLCNDLEIPIDVPHFFYEMSDIVAGLVQGHRPGNIERACEFMISEKNDNAKEDIEAFASWVLENHSELCMDFSYANNIEKFRNVEWNSVANQQMRQWIYQTCSEFAWFQTSSSKNQFFGTTYGVEYFFRICNDLYDNSFSEQLITHNVRRTNYRFGGFRPDLTNVVFTNGDLDPWHPMSILEDLSEHATAIIIPLASHVSDLGAISENDSDEMRASKLRVKELVRKWVGILNYDEKF